MQQYERAKELFLAAKGSTFFLYKSDDGSYEEYMSYNVPRELQNSWRKELLGKISDAMLQARGEKNIKACIYDYTYIIDTDDMGEVKFLLDFIKVLPTSSMKMLIIDTIFTVFLGIEKIEAQIFRYEETKAALEILKGMQVLDVIPVDESFKQNAIMPRLFDQDKLKARLERQIKTYEEEVEKQKQKLIELKLYKE